MIQHPPHNGSDAGNEIPIHQDSGPLASSDSASNIEPPATGPSPPNSTPGTLPSFPRYPGETPRAFSAFTTFFSLGHTRSLQAVADQLGEKLGTVKKWSSRFRWGDRIQSFNAGLLQQQVAAEIALREEQVADWARRTCSHREREWQAAEKLLGAAECYLDSFGDREVEKMTLTQVSRAFQISSSIARQALSGAAVPEGPALAPLQLELIAALEKAYANPPSEEEPATPLPPTTPTNKP
jgi:hypothetical protein